MRRVDARARLGMRTKVSERGASVCGAARRAWHRVRLKDVTHDQEMSFAGYPMWRRAGVDVCGRGRGVQARSQGTALFARFQSRARTRFAPRVKG